MDNFYRELKAEEEKEIKKKLKEVMKAKMKDFMKEISRMVASEKGVSAEKVEKMAEGMFEINEKNYEEETEEKKFANKM